MRHVMCLINDRKSNLQDKDLGGEFVRVPPSEEGERLSRRLGRWIVDRLIGWGNGHARQRARNERIERGER